MVCIITEPSYGTSMWGKTLSESLKSRLKEKRIPFEENPPEISAQAECVFMIASDELWIKNNIAIICGAEHKVILLCSRKIEFPGYTYSCVYSDISGSVKHLLEKYFIPEKTKAVLYAVNKSSAADAGKLLAVRSCVGGFYDLFKVIRNDVSLEKCFEEFLGIAAQTDLCIALNDFAAISLVCGLKQRCPQLLGKLKIISFSQNGLSSFYKNYIESIDTNYESFGKTAVSIYERLKKHTYITEISAGVGTYPEIRRKRTAKTVCPDCTTGSAAFYSDKELHRLSAAECFLNISNDTDMEIFRMLCRGFTLEQIAEKCFLTESGVKYRIKSLVSLCGVQSKDELCKILESHPIFK